MLLGLRGPGIQKSLRPHESVVVVVVIPSQQGLESVAVLFQAGLSPLLVARQVGLLPPLWSCSSPGGLPSPPPIAGWILIDRCGKHFGTILNYLRDGAVPLPESRREIEELLAEAKYYLVQGLVEECQAALQNKDTYEPFCKVPVITSSKEEQKLIATSNKPAVKLLYNRSNNKYSYTSNSDDNMLKNIELFDKLSLRFNGRVLFIKDVIGDEICCWSFYGQGRKIAEVCCTSIVYATEKKQTKVEFPEARIYEETLNILLYEAQDGRGPDNALLEATGGAAGRSHHLDEDEERERERIERVRRIHIKRPDDRAHLHQ
ncbi:BTB/POZ domain-containing adapter for CUL3-mediated RhoA degradation protein 3 [Leptonychotes weddellii]|uniref:BTB/POZ domain-containing adapter for CUL3-mediated RhoA degradation protein 3 n=1 Tax=Leptonychotes weddellii TaxID=9713 RepID=A0A2U3YEX3_LEPWE|nr:BTB/POZ domain-containing adapter for CUL3-mediated RhoA degradation protein 3 [Leptonychotes weddellii]